MKPTPPDQDRIEIVINGDDPESHRAAQETARILAAPQLAQVIKKRIDDCRNKILAVTSMMIWCDEGDALTDKQIYSIHVEIRSQYLNLMLSMKRNYELKFSHDCSVTWNAVVGEGREACDKLATLLPPHLKELQEELKKYDAQLDDLFVLVTGQQQEEVIRGDGFTMPQKEEVMRGDGFTMPNYKPFRR